MNPRSLLPLILLTLAPLPEAAAQANAAKEKPAPKAAADDKAWLSLFDGKTLAGWKSTEFGGEGDVTVQDGAIVMELGQDMSGITWAGKDPLPKNNYEIALDAQRVDGTDFFCGLTFPVNDSHCSFIVGGWGGGVVGLSSINGFDASENDTTQYMEFKTGQWYKIRVRVTPNRIQTWIDEKEVVDQDIEDRKVSTRGEMELSKPLGVATWNTKGALRNIRLRKLDAQPAAAKKAD
jgi:hypothetical protein